MTAKLFSKSGKTRGSSCELTREATIGRDGENSLVIDRPLVSNRHARIAYDEESGRYVLEDLGSLNGTELDGERIRGPERLGHLHVITFAGTYDFFFQDLERCARRHVVTAARTDPASTSEEPATPERDERETTRREKLPIPLPGNLARSAGASAGEPAPERDERETTRGEKLPVALPGNLARRLSETSPAATPPEEERLPDELALPAETSLSQEMAPPEKVASPEEAPGPPQVAPPEARPHELALPEKSEGLAALPAERTTFECDDPDHLAEMAEAIGLLAGPSAAGGQEPAFRLRITEASGRVLELNLAEGENLVGRGRGAGIRMQNRDLSRCHAILEVTGERIKVRDLDSRNGTFVNGEQIRGEIEVSPDARLRFGSVEARLIGTEDSDNG